MSRTALSASRDAAAEHRIVAVDIVRGLAIFIMIPANIAGSIYAEPHAFWFRVVSSFAAPTFITIAGMMTAVSANAAQHSWRHYASRGGLLLAAAAAVDVLIWRIVPFYSVDVLYLIGVACPITYWFARPRRGRLALAAVAAAVIFALTPILQWTFGYTDVPDETYLWGADAGQKEAVAIAPTGLMAHWFIDGYFPIFPWLGLSIAGAALAAALFGAPANRRRLGLIAAALLLAGTALWLHDPGRMYVRDGYSELFYPPTIGFVATALGVVMALLMAVQRTATWRLYRPLQLLGRCALLMYILHLAIIAYVLEPMFENLRLAAFLAVSLATVIVLLAVAAAVDRLKVRWKPRPYVLRFLLGG